MIAEVLVRDVPQTSQVAKSRAEEGCSFSSRFGGGSPALFQSGGEMFAAHGKNFSPRIPLSKLRTRGLGPLAVEIKEYGKPVYHQLDEAARAQLPQLLAAPARRSAEAESTQS